MGLRVEELSEVTRRQLIVAATGLLVEGCRTAATTPQPNIRFTRIPKGDSSGSDKNDIIEGTVTGAREGQQIVLYAKNGSWWLQPLLEAPFTKISSSNKWLNATHLGSDYAALLVDRDYRPDRNIKTLPAAGGPVAAVSATKGASASPAPTLQFSDYEWRVRTAASNRGGRNNPYSAANAFVDDGGALHLCIKKKGDRFECAEVALARSLGYGTYTFAVRDVSKLPRDLMLQLFTWDYSGGSPNHREMDVVILRRQAAPMATARFVVQPYQVSTNTCEFNLPPGAYAHSFRWEAEKIEFATSSASGHRRTVAQHNFTLGVPTPGLESVRMALYLPNSASQHPTEAEVVIDRFEYAP